jgi:ribosomal protein S18 acetylase RimI-like enzyme
MKNSKRMIVFEPGSPEFSGPAASSSDWKSDRTKLIDYLRGEPDRGMYTEISVRPYEPADFPQLAQVYKSAFAEPPWDEFRKCGECGVNYGRQEVASSSYIPRGAGQEAESFEYPVDSAGEMIKSCKKCGTDMSAGFGGCDPYWQTPNSLVPFWSDTDIQADLEFALSQEKPIALVAGNCIDMLGFTWGYQLSMEKFSFLNGIVRPDACYMDEIAVTAGDRQKGIGRLLGEEFEESAYQNGMPELVLRTDRRNTASMGLFQKLGYTPVKNAASPDGCMYDPEYPDRIYLAKMVEPRKG